MKTRRVRQLEAELGRTQYALSDAQRRLAFCEPKSRDEWIALYEERDQWPDKLPCGWCGAPHDEVDHEILSRPLRVEEKREQFNTWLRTEFMGPK